ncbi:MAG TPA: hydantoinase/oxoprolinase family protein [Burkholderiaceae bacterium]|mgnify:FL=1|nr:hydantoinase/oxoprolinase family protein [Burkholderiaceae bacterium]
MSHSSYLIGVDTGGTYTDCAIIEARGHKVVARAKAITTKGDLAIGVSEAINLAVAQLPAGLAPQDIGLVSVSTTLATNAVVEGHGSPVAVVLVGFDDRMAERTGIASAFPGLPIIRIAGGHDHNGAPAQPLDLQALQQALDTVSASVDAFAVASTFAVRNAAHEQAVRDHIVAATGKPVTLSSELSSALDAPRRALTAALNARLIARVSTLIDAVQRAMAQLQIECPLMIVKGDGTLALAESVATRPIETVLSGPAASLVGAQWMSGLQSFILSDMGGTTTDLGVLQDGRPRITEQGAEVGGWRTMVRAIDVRTIGLGGDSEIHIGANGRLSVGPQRIVPVALLGARYPQVMALLEADLADVQGGSALHGHFVLLPFGARAGAATIELQPREREMLAQVTEQPQSLRKLARSFGAQRILMALKRKGLVQIGGLTPSDAAHVLGLQHNWSTPAAMMAAQLGCRLRDMKFPTPERTQQFARDIWSETVRLSARAILDTAVGEHLDENKLVQAVCAGDGMLGLARISVTPSIPVVAVGGPVGVFYGEVGRRLGCQIVFPEHADVANAIGAATGVVAQTVAVHVAGDGSGLFVMHSPAGTRQFTDPAEAIEAATILARQAATDAVLAMGAVNPQVRLLIRKELLPNATSDAGLLEAVVTAEAVGRPNGAQ